MAERIRKHSVMIVDDDELVARSLSRVFSINHFECYTVCNPEETTEKIKAIRPDVIIMDVQMPRKDGLEILKEIREFDNNTPVIMMSGNMDKTRAEVLIKLGATECFEKPISPFALFDRVKQLIK